MDGGQSTAWPLPERTASADLGVLAAIAGLLVLMAVAVLAAVFLILGLRDDTTRLTGRQVAYVEAVHRAALQAKGIANDERGYLLTRRPVFLREVAARTKLADDAFGDATRAATGEGQTIAIEETRAGYSRWLKALHADIDDFRAGRRARAIESVVGPTRDLRKDYERMLDLAHVLGVAAMNRESSSVSEASSRSVTFLLAYLAAALLIGGALAFWIVRRMLRIARAHAPQAEV